MVKKARVSYLVFFLLVKGYAQTIPTFSAPEPPKVFEFSKYDQVPVGEYTGIPNIQIPLHEVDVDGVRIPVAVQYHAGGIRVSEKASMVGLGWNMNFGMITQTINDLDDLGQFDKKLLLYQDSPYASEWAIPESPLNIWTNVTASNCPIFTDGTPKVTNSIFIATSRFVPIANASFCYGQNTQCLLQPSYNCDTEPDVFRANFFGHSIKFIKKFTGAGAGEIVILNDAGYKIELVNNKWEISDVSGNRYTFGFKQTHTTAGFTSSGAIAEVGNYGGAPSLVEGSGSSSSSSTYWFLEKVTTKLNKIIQFEYYDFGYSSTKNYSQTYRKVNWSPMSNYPCSFKGVLGNPIVHIDGVINRITTNTIYEPGLYVKKISSPSGNINFSYTDRSDGGKKLDQITSYNINGSLVDQTDFAYDYFVSSSSGNQVGSESGAAVTHRLKLNSIKKMGSNPYKFNYNPIALPRKNSTAVDLWGFYNGEVTNASLAANPSEMGFPQHGNNGNKKAASPTFIKASTLEEIVFPTGGKAVYEYEINEFEKDPFGPNIPNHDGTLGSVIKGFGIRLKSYSLYDRTELRKRTNFSYSGGKSITPYRFYNFSNVTVGLANVVNNSIYNAEIKDFHGSNSYTPNVFGSYNSVGYDKVTKEDMSENGSNGKLVTTYMNVRDAKPHATSSGTFDETRGMLPLPSIQDINSTENGKTLSEELFNFSNSLVQKKEYTYTTKKSSIHYGNIFANFRDLVYTECSGYLGGFRNQSVPQFAVGYYAIYGKKSLKSSEKLTEYFPAGSKWQRTVYQYNDHHLLLSEITYDNVGTEISSDSRQFYTSAYAVSKNQVDLVKQQTIFSRGKRNVVDFTYQLQGSLILPVRGEIWPGGNASPLAKTVQFFDSYDDRGNLVEFHSENGLSTCIIWGYNKMLPIAKVENATYNQILPYIANIQDLSNSTSEPGLVSALNALRNALPNAMVTTYTHKPGIGISTITDHKGKSFYYQYDLGGRLVEVKDGMLELLAEYEYNFRPQN